MSEFSPVVIPDDAPDVIIGAVDVLRSILHPTERPDAFRWQVWAEGSVRPDGRVLKLFGDLTVTQGGWFGGSTSYVVVTFRGSSTPGDAVTDDEMLARYGPWAAHVLWDLATMNLRTVAAGSAGIGFELPSTTPVPLLRFDRDAGDEQEGAD